MRPTPETDAERHDPTEIIIKSLRILARDIQSDDGVANLALLEAADCLERVARERDEAREALEEETRFHNRTHKQLSKTKCKLMDAMQAIIDTLEENRYLADGDDCTLAKLKAVVPDWK